MGSQCK